VLGVEEDPLPLPAQVGDRVADHGKVLFQGRAQGQPDVPVMTLGDKGHDRRARLAQRGDQRVIGRLDAGPAGRAERGELRVLELQLGGCEPEELGVLRDGAGPAALDEPDAELVEPGRDRQLVGDGQVQALLLCAITQGGVVDVERVVGHRIPVSFLIEMTCLRKTKDPSLHARGLRVAANGCKSIARPIGREPGTGGTGARPAGRSPAPGVRGVAPRASTTGYGEVDRRSTSSRRRATRLPIMIRPDVMDSAWHTVLGSGHFDLSI
jgi:hypothetical protein